MLYNLEIKIGTRYYNLDLPDNFTVAFNYQLKDFEKPSDIKTGFSKSITILGTPNNNNLLSNIWKLSSIYDIVNPNKKIDYRLSFNGCWVSSGYMSIDNITNNKDNITYKATLYDDTNNKLKNIKFKEDGELRYLNELTFDFDDEFSSYDYDMHYVMDAWSKFGELQGINGYKWEAKTDVTKSLKSYLMPIYSNFGLYDDFSSDMFIGNVQDGSIARNPFRYNPTKLGYDDVHIPVQGETFNESDDKGLTYAPYKGYVTYITERELHPAEAHQIIANRCPIGIDLGKTWQTIIKEFGIDDSLVSEKTNKILNNTYMLLPFSGGIDETNNTVDYKDADNSYFNKKLSADVKNGEFNFFWSKPRWGTAKKYNLVEGNNIHFKLFPTMKASTGERGGNYVFANYMGFNQSPIQLKFNQSPNVGEVPQHEIDWANNRQEITCFDNAFIYNITLFRVKHITDIYRNGQFYTSKTHKSVIYAYCGQGLDDVNKFIVSTYAMLQIKEYFNEIERGDASLNMENFWSNWNVNKANQSFTEIIAEKNIDFYSNGRVDIEGEKRPYIQYDSCSFTIMIPQCDYANTDILPNFSDGGYYNSMYGCMRLPNYEDYIHTPINNEPWGTKHPMPDDGNSRFTLKTINTYDSGLTNYNVNAGLFKTFTTFLSEVAEEDYWVFNHKTFFNNHTYRIPDDQLRIQGAYILRSHYDRWILERFSVDSVVQVSEYSGSEFFGYPKISKDLLNKVKVGDLFINICKLLNINVYNDILNEKVKLIFNNDMFVDNVVDLSDRVDFSSIDNKPTVIKSSIYKYSIPMVESYYDEIYERKNKDYNIRSLTYDYNLSNDPIETEIDFKSAIPYNMQSIWMNDDILLTDEGTYFPKYFIPAVKGSKYTEILYRIDENKEIQTLEKTHAGLMYSRPDAIYEDYKVDDKNNLCFFDKDLKTVEFENTLVSFGGLRNQAFPTLVAVDIPAAKQLNDTYCYYSYLNRTENPASRNDVLWDLDTNLRKGWKDCYFDLLSTPIFNNYKEIDGDKLTLAYTNLNNIEFGVTNLFDEIYYHYYDVIFNEQNKLIKLNVKLDVGSINDIMRKIYYIDGSYYVIHKLNNYDFGKDFNQVEFIQINKNKLKDLKPTLLAPTRNW